MEMHKYVEPIDRRIKKLRKEIEEREWNGEKVDHLYKQMNALKYLSEQGEKWNVLF